MPPRPPGEGHRRLTLQQGGQPLVDRPVAAGRVDALVDGDHVVHELEGGDRIGAVDVALGGVGIRVPQRAAVGVHHRHEIVGDPVGVATALPGPAVHAVLGQGLGHLAHLFPGRGRGRDEVGAVPERLRVEAPRQAVDRGVGVRLEVPLGDFDLVGRVLGEA